MNTIFKYNVNARYSTKDLKGVYNSNNFSLLDVYLNEKGPTVKIQLPNIFKDHHIIAKPKPITADDEWPLSLPLWRNFCDSHGKYRPELKILPCFVQQVHLVFRGNSSIIQIYLYAMFKDFMCIFMYD